MAVWSRCALSLAVKTFGRYGEALALSSDAVARAFEPVHADARLRHPHFFVGMASADADRMDEAHAAYARAIEEAQKLGTAWLLPDMLQLAAEAHFLVGAWDDEHARRGGRLIDHAGTCEDAASVLAAAGRVPEATDLLREAHALYSSIDASAWAARVASALRGLGVRPGTGGPRRRSTTGWASLTDSERAVAELVAQGLTNREVAGRLHISPDTVNTHLRHVFQKLEVATRAELAAKAARCDLTHSSDVSPG